MTTFSITDFHAAMSAARHRLRVPDDELKLGHVEMIQVGELPGPFAMPGGRAIVYKYRTRSGGLKALRLWYREVSGDMKQRYEALGTYFAQHAEGYTARFRYHDQGILVKNGTTNEQRVFPLVEMDWIEHVTLLKRIDDLCLCGDQAGLQDLLERWQVLVTKMHAAQIAHGDLCGDNVIVRPGGDLMLIDYDATYIPPLKKMGPVVEGKRDFQHPQWDQRPYDESMDAFSALLIYTAISALQVSPDLWKKLTPRGTGGSLPENILFTEDDLRRPDAALS